MLFADTEIDEILEVRERREQQARADYFAYFSDLALEYYGTLIAARRGQLLADLTNAAMRGPFLSTVRVPIHTVRTFAATSPLNREVRRLYENEVYNTGAWFESNSGLNRANLYAIFTHSDLQQRMNAMLGRGMRATMTSYLARTSALGVREYTVTLWLSLSMPGR